MRDPARLQHHLAAYPATSLVAGPTPLEPLEAVSTRVGREVWIKRDDLLGFGLGGNKVRKLEFLLGDALAVGADCVITVGAVQSNHARATAAAAATSGLPCHLVLGGAADLSAPTGNALAAEQLFGASLVAVPSKEWSAVAGVARELRERLEREGRRPYVIPLGGATPTGCLGLARAFLELRTQCHERGLDRASVVVASATGGTQAGLAFASAALDPAYRITGVDVAKITTDLAGVVRGLIADMERLLCVTLPRPPDVEVLDGYVGDGYARVTAGAIAALRGLARMQGVVLDPVYTSKAFQALWESDPRLGDGPVVFWHTGGTPAVFSSEIGPPTWPPAP